MEKPLYPSFNMRITQGFMEGTHRDSYAIDDAGKDTGSDYIRAPFTGVIKKIYTQDANEVWLESVDPVQYPDGTLDHMTIMFAHNNDVSNLSVGQIISQGAKFYKEGTKGNATGNHVHIECGQGKFTGSGWHQNSAGYWAINNGKNPTECLWLDDNVVVLDDHGYNFQKMMPPPSEEVPKEEPPKEEVPKEELPKEEQLQAELIFTCAKKDVYAIYLEKGQKLYLE